MNIVTFPEFNIEVIVNRIAFSIGRIQIYWYSILICIAVIIGVVLAKRHDGLYDIKFNNVFEGILISIPISILFARIYYVIFNVNKYAANIKDVFNIRNGGIAIYGALIGGIISIFIYCRAKNIKFLDLLDYIIPYVALGQAIGRWGNFINIEAYGNETTTIFRMGIIQDGIYKEVHPTFLYESLLAFILFIMLVSKQKKRKYSSEISIIYFMIYSFFRAFIEELRVDSLMIYNYRVSQILSILIFICMLISYIYHAFKNFKKLNHEEMCKGEEG